MVLFVVGNHNACPAEQDSTAVTCLIHIRKACGSNLGRFTGYPDQFVHVNTSTRPRLETCNDHQLSRYSDWDTGWMSGDAGGSISCEVKGFFSVTASGLHPDSCSTGIGIISRLGRKANRSFSFKAGVTNVWSYTSTPHYMVVN